MAVASGVADNHVEELTQLTAQMLQTREFPEVHEQGFAKAFTDIANRLEKHHDIALHSPVDAAKTQLAEPTPEVEKAVELETAIAAEAPQPEASQPKAKTSFAAREKAEKKAIAPKTSMTEHVTAQPEALTASLST